MVATSVADQSGNAVRWCAAIGIAAAIGVTLCAAGSSSATADVRIVPSCKRDNIQLTFGRGGVATGHAFIRIMLRNVGKAPCARLRHGDHPFSEDLILTRQESTRLGADPNLHNRRCKATEPWLFYDCPVVASLSFRC